MKLKFKFDRVFKDSGISRISYATTGHDKFLGFSYLTVSYTSGTMIYDFPGSREVVQRLEDDGFSFQDKVSIKNFGDLTIKLVFTDLPIRDQHDFEIHNEINARILMRLHRIKENHKEFTKIRNLQEIELIEKYQRYSNHYRNSKCGEYTYTDPFNNRENRNIYEIIKVHRKLSTYTKNVRKYLYLLNFTNKTLVERIVNKEKLPKSIIPTKNFINMNDILFDCIYSN